MAFRPDAHKQLIRYVEAVSGEPNKETIRGAVLLTEDQRASLEFILRKLWGRTDYRCPLNLDVKPQHGYRSRVLKDGFTAEKYAEWLVAGCSDTATVGTDANGRPHLLVAGTVDGNHVYDIVVPIRSDASGYVHVDDVIPKGLPPKSKARADRP